MYYKSPILFYVSFYSGANGSEPENPVFSANSLNAEHTWQETLTDFTAVTIKNVTPNSGYEAAYEHIYSGIRKLTIPPGRGGDGGVGGEGGYAGYIYVNNNNIQYFNNKGIKCTSTLSTYRKPSQIRTSLFFVAF